MLVLDYKHRTTTSQLFAVLKDEPEDLTHLAPTAGDTCIPLENTPFDMFEDFILSDNYCSLLGDDLATGSPVDSLTADSLLSSPDPQVNFVDFVSFSVHSVFDTDDYAVYFHCRKLNRHANSLPY